MRSGLIGTAALLALLAGGAQAGELLTLNGSGNLKAFTTPGLDTTHNFFPFGVGSGLGQGSVGAFANRDGHDDLVVGSGGGGGVSLVKVYNTTTGEQTGEFIPFAGYTGGIRVAAGDVNGDG